MNDAASPPLQSTETAGRSPDEAIRALLESAMRALGLFRVDLAGKLEIDVRTLQNWLASPSELSPQKIERLAVALELNPESRANLYILTGHLPPAPPAPSASELIRTPDMATYQEILDDCSHPSVVYDYAWDVVLTNKPYRDLFGSVRRHATAWPLHNGMKYILWHPDAPQQLGGGDPEEFRESWLMPALANFIVVFQQRPDDPHLQNIEREILQRTVTRRAYEGILDWIRTSGDLHVNSSPRPIWDPRCEAMRFVNIRTEAHQVYQPLTLTHATFVFSRMPTSAPGPAWVQPPIFTL